MTQIHPQPTPGTSNAPELVVEPATADDIDAMHQLIETTSRTTTVLPRSRENIGLHLRDFLVVREGARILGCGALALFTRQLAEIKSLVVVPELRGRGVGQRLVRALVDEGRRLGVRRIFALTDNPPFFERAGFTRVDKATLPHKVWNECIHCPKFLNCQEDAVEMILGDAAGRSGAARSLEESEP